MPKVYSEFVCQQCGAKSPTYLGKCPECGSWNSFVETVFQANSSSAHAILPDIAKITQLSQVLFGQYQRFTSNLQEVDRVLGGGIVPGSVMLLAGEPGIGKSTLVTQIAMNLASQSGRVPLRRSFEGQAGEQENRRKKSQALKLSGSVIYVSGEESAHQIKMRADRLGKIPDNLFILTDTDVDRIIQAIEGMVGQNDAGRGGRVVVIIDSIQTMTTSDLTGVGGSVGQVKEVTSRLIKLAKHKHISMFLVGHVTKEGAIAGPKVLEHLVDVVLWLEGSRDQSVRLLRGVKNRFGATDEVGIFEMTGDGMKEVVDPAQLFLPHKNQSQIGSVTTCVIEGTRPFLVEVQTLVVPTAFGMPRRVVSGFDYNRLQLILAILTKVANLPLGSVDVYVNVAGGMVIRERAADLAVALSVASSIRNVAVPARLAAFGELGLLGEIRPVPGTKRRVTEAKKLGIAKVITPDNAKDLGYVFGHLFKK